MDQRDVDSLLRLNSCDVRQSLLQLQFWTRSGGGRTAAAAPPSNSGGNGKDISQTASIKSTRIRPGKFLNASLLHCNKNN